jgi:lipopolysaccharide export system permease protein
MTRIERYIFRQAIGALVIVLAALVAVVWIALALRQLNLVTTQGQSALVLLEITLLALPNLMGLIAPVALLVACLFVANRLAGDSELVVLAAAGAPVWRVARPLLLLALVVSLAVSLVSHIVMPWSLQRIRALVLEVRTDLIGQVIQPGRFTSPETDLTFHIRDRTLSGDLLGLMVHDARDGRPASTYLAERAVILRQGTGAALIMEKGHVLRRASPSEPVHIIAFDRYMIDLASFEPKGFDAPALKPRERTLAQLLEPGAAIEADPRLLGPVRAELHERFSGALYPIAFVMIVVAFVGGAKTTRRGRVNDIAAAFGMAAGLRVAGLWMMNLASLRPAAQLGLYLLPLGGFLAAAGIAWWNMRPRRPLRSGRRRTPPNADRVGPAGGRAPPLRPQTSEAGR